MAKTHKAKKAKQLAAGQASSSAQTSPFVQQTQSLYLPLSPCAANFPIEGLCAEHISPLILTYYPPFSGVLLSYANARISEHPNEAQATSNDEVPTVFTRSIDEYGVTYVWLTAEFLVFQPKRGTVLEGFIILQNESILGLLCYNYFNVGIQYEKLPKDWTWDGECWLDGNRNKVEGMVKFRVDDFEASGTEAIQIAGTLLL